MRFRLFRQAAKIDYLAGQPGFAQTPEGRAGIHMLRTRYPESADKAFPLLFREYKRGMDSGGKDGLVIPPSYLDNHRMMDAYQEQDPAHAKHFEAILNGDRPDAYFWKMRHSVDGPEYEPVQPGMMQNLARMLQWMKGANQPLPNMDAKSTTLDHVQQLYNDWRAKYDTDRDQHLGTIAHTFPNNWTMRTCDNPAECYDEGEEMAHCAAKYAPLVQQGSHTLYSLRDPQNRPHASFVYRPDEHTLEDVRGKANQPVNSEYLQYLTDYFPLMGEGLTISGHPDPQAPPIPEVNQYGLPVVGAEAQRQGDRIARILGYPVERQASTHLGWVIEADKLNDFLRGKVYQTRPCDACGGKKFIEDPATGKRGRCPECHGKGSIPVLDDKGQPVIDRHYYPEFSDPNHPDYPTASPVLDALEKQYHSDQNDQLFPFLVNQYKRGQLRMNPAYEADVYNPDSGQYEPRMGDPTFEHATDPEELSDNIQERVERLRDRGYNDDYIRDWTNRHDNDHWENIKGSDWKPLDRERLDSYGQWLKDTTSQHPSRHGLEVWDSRANDGEGGFVPHPKYPNNFDLNNATFAELDARRKAYDEWLEAKQSIDRAIFKSEDGKHHMVELRPDECQREGTTMQNCITSYGDQLANKGSIIYSLRDKNGHPHLDMELNPKFFHNKQTKETIPFEDYQVMRHQVGGAWEDCRDCNGYGRRPQRDEEGNPVTNAYGETQREGTNCPTCEGRGQVRLVADPGLKERLEGFEPSPFDATVKQIQGKNNKPALPQYQRPVKEFFSKFPQDRLPKWDLQGRSHFTDFGTMFGEDGHAIYYHPGDYGLPDPGITTDYPSLVRSYLEYGKDDDVDHRRRADFLVNRWAKGHGQLDQLREALAEPNLLDGIKQQATQGFNPHNTEEMRAWEQANPNPRQGLNNPAPNWFDEEGNYRDEAPDFQQELAGWEQREQETWRAEEAWQTQRDELARQLRDQYAGDAYQQLPGYKRWEYANTLANGEDLAVPRVNEDMQVVGSVRTTPEWCICGKCEPEWNLIRVANEQVWNKVRNTLRKNNILSDENLAAWEHMKKLYPDASHLGEFLHREFRKGRLRMPESPYEISARANEERAQRYEDAGNEYYQERALRYRELAEQERRNGAGWEIGDTPFTIPNFEHKDFRNGELSPELMQHFVEEVKKQGQREKGWNIMKQEIAPLAQTAAEAAAAARRTKYAGDVVYSAPANSPNAGWNVRYINSPEAAVNEKEMMGHCVDKYGDRILCGATHNYSVRDPNGRSHRTLEFLKDQSPDASMSTLNDATGNVLDWDKIRAAMPDWDIDKHQQAVEGFLNGANRQNGGGPDVWDTFNHDYADETRDFLRQARERGAIETPKTFPGNWRVYQNTGGSGSAVGGNTQQFIREWMDSLPWDQRPVGMTEYRHAAQQVYTPHKLLAQQPAAEGQPVDEYGFRKPEGQGQGQGTPRFRWNNIVHGIAGDPLYNDYGDQNYEPGERPYDPEMGQRLYEWARDNNELKNFYNAVAKWERNPRQYQQEPRRQQQRPMCPDCEDRYDVRPNDNPNVPNPWHCGYCGLDFGGMDLGVNPRQNIRYGPQYNEYQQAAVQHLAPLFGQHPELVADATLPSCPSCGRQEYVESRADGTYYCGYCGNSWRAAQASFEDEEPRNYVPHIDSYGKPCRCPWYEGPPTNMGDFEVIANIPSDWGEDSDSGLGEPEPAWNYAPPHEKANIVPCPVCQDPMENGECKRCDWGDWGREQPTPNPHDPFRDLKSPVQSSAS